MQEQGRTAETLENRLSFRGLPKPDYPVTCRGAELGQGSGSHQRVAATTCGAQNRDSLRFRAALLGIRYCPLPTATYIKYAAAWSRFLGP